MKQHNTILGAVATALSALALLFLSSCEEKFEFRKAIALDAHVVNLKAAQGSTPIIVYANDEWKASFSEPVEWASLDRLEGSGFSSVKFSYSENFGMGRKVTVVFTSKGHRDTVLMVQAAGMSEPTFQFKTSSIELPKYAGTASLPLTTNLVYEMDKVQWTAIDDTGDDASWLKDVSVSLSGVSFSYSSASETRTADLILTLKTSDGSFFSTTAKITQKAEAAYMTFDSEVTGAKYAAESIDVTVPFTTNLTAYLDAIYPTVTSDADWAVVDLAGWTDYTKIPVTLLRNPTTEERHCTITFTFTDPDGTTETFSFTLYQKGQVTHYTIDQVKAWITGATGTVNYTGEGLLDAVSIGDKDNANMGDNTNVTNNTMEYETNHRTGYIQNAAGTAGMMLLFDTVDANTLVRYAQVTLDLNGLTLTKYANPTRYVLSGIKAANVASVANPSSVNVPVKEKSIADLTDDDIYTYVTVKTVEFPFKTGAYTNCYDNYQRALTLEDGFVNPNGNALNNSGGSASNQYFDATPCPFVDDAGATMYMLTNNETPWRRYGQGVKQGTCDISGIVVYSHQPRWALNGDIGRYTLRVLEEEDIKEVSPAFSKMIVGWIWNSTHVISGTDLSLNPTYPAASTATIKCSVPSCNVRKTVDFNWPFNGKKGDPGTTDTNYGGRDGTGAVSWTCPTKTPFWNSSNVNDASKAPYWELHFSTADFSGSNMYMHWSPGLGTGNATYPYSNIHLPTKWHVEYSTDGSNFTSCSGDYAFHPITWWNAQCSRHAVGGRHNYVTKLPASLLGKTDVWIRIKASSNEMSVYNNDGTSTELGGVIDAQTNTNHQLCLGEIGFWCN